MVGGGFQHDVCSSALNIPKIMEWDISGNANISFHIDNGIYFPVDKTKRNFAWIVESASIIPAIIEWVKDNIPYMEEKFELIFTHDRRLLSLSDKMRLVICNAAPWVVDRKVHEKTKMISMIASNKRLCQGHLHRQSVLEKYRNQMDCFGRGYNFVDKKEAGLNDYHFSIAVMNDNYPNYFTEIITDCFATGTIPIYWGSDAICEFFNTDGIIWLTDDFDVNDLSVDLYHSKMEAVLENFEKVCKLPVAEDYIIEKFINN